MLKKGCLKFRGLGDIREVARQLEASKDFCGSFTLGNFNLQTLS
jgi:hypothetical protein